MTRFFCSTCGNEIQIANEEAGHLVECPTCHTNLTVPGAAARTAPMVNRSGLGLLAAGFVAGGVMALWGIFAAYICLMGEKLEVVNLVFDFLIAGYGLTLLVAGGVTCLVEWNQKYQPPVRWQKIREESPWRWLFFALCNFYGVASGIGFARPGFIWMTLGLVVGAITGAIGAAACSRVLDRWNVSVPRRLHACFFVSFLSMLLSIGVARLFWQIIG